jgi:hypothetical protein
MISTAISLSLTSYPMQAWTIVTMIISRMPESGTRYRFKLLRPGNETSTFTNHL